MTAIRPDLPAFAPGPAPAGADQARRAFFGQALERAQAPATQAATYHEPAAIAQTQASSPTERMARPGALLDIRV